MKRNYLQLASSQRILNEIIFDEKNVFSHSSYWYTSQGLIMLPHAILKWWIFYFMHSMSCSQEIWVGGFLHRIEITSSRDQSKADQQINSRVIDINLFLPGFPSSRFLVCASQYAHKDYDYDITQVFVWLYLYPSDFERDLSYIVCHFIWHLHWARVSYINHKYFSFNLTNL